MACRSVTSQMQLSQIRQCKSILNASSGLIYPVLLKNKLIKKLLGTSLEVYSIRSLRFFFTGQGRSLVH